MSLSSSNPLSYMGVQAQNPPDLIKGARAPDSGDRRYKIGTFWLDTSANQVYQFVGVDSGSAVWDLATFPVNYLRQATVEVSSAELLALRATPKTLLDAPGAGLFYEFVSALLILNYNAAAYVVGTNDMAIRLTDGSGVILSQAIESTSFLDQTADTITNALPRIDAVGAASAIVNQALVLHNTGAGEFTTGDSPISVIVNYRIHQSGL